MLVGQEAFRRIATLAIAGDSTPNSLQRFYAWLLYAGRFCELSAPLCSQPPSEQYLIGIISLFPTMLQVTIEELMRMLPLRQKASDALRGKGNAEGALLDWIVAYEHSKLGGLRCADGGHQSAPRRLDALPRRSTGIGPKPRCFCSLPVTVEIDIETRFTGEHEHAYNTIAEIPGNRLQAQ